MPLRGCAPSGCAMNSGSVSRVNPTECTALRTGAQTKAPPCQRRPPRTIFPYQDPMHLFAATPGAALDTRPGFSHQDPMHLFAATPGAALGTRVGFSHQDPTHLFAATPGAALDTRAGFSHQDPMHLFAATSGAALGSRAEFRHQDPMHQFEAAPATRILCQPRPLAPIPSHALLAEAWTQCIVMRRARQEAMHREPARVRLRRHTGPLPSRDCLPRHRLPHHRLPRHRLPHH
jgi:hypothetical protein